MRISVEWLKEILPGLKANPQAIARRLTDVGHEVEEVIRQSEAIESVIVGEVRDLRGHPNADRLRVATVFDGEKELTVVCGAPNVAKGQKIAFAPIGTSLPNGMTMERRAIRGVTSEGMICSEAELGLSDEADGILVLGARAKPGKAIASHVKRTDTLLEVSATPNRPDVLSHFGTARELAAAYGLPKPKLKLGVSERGAPASTRAKIEIRSGPRCPRYLGRVIVGVEIGPSPDWVVRRLEAVGQRSISNVVDATNLALMELGHPLHAFDLSKLRGGKVIVRLAKEGEVLKTIDDVERKLDKDDLVIADAAGPIALAGVMGGFDSGVSDQTVDILLESAMFEPRGVRRTSKRHGLHTEASHRFERGADPLGLEAAIDSCAARIVELAGGQVLPGRIEVVKREHQPKQVSIRPSRASLLLGRTVDRKEVIQTLNALGLKKIAAPTAAPTGGRKKKNGRTKTKSPASDAIFFEAPSWRHDLEREVDLIEEVARLAGYDSIPTSMPALPAKLMLRAPPIDPESLARRTLAAQGFFEAVSLAFNAGPQIEHLGGDLRKAVQIANPLGEESRFLRASMLPGLLESALRNQEKLRRTDLRLFELGRTFAWTMPGQSLPEERHRIGLLLRGRRYPSSWNNGDTNADFYDLKAVIESLLAAFEIREAEYQADTTAWLHPASATRVLVKDQVVGRLGEMHPDAMSAFSLEGPSVFVAELELDAIAAAHGQPRHFVPLMNQPPVLRDLAFFLDRDVTATKILTSVRQSGGSLLESADVFDVYEGKGVPEGQRSIALRLSFRSGERTLTASEVEEALGQIVGQLRGGLGAKLREA